MISGGNYLFVNSTSVPFGRALLVSLPVTTSSEKSCLHFSYFMYGPAENSCQLLVKIHRYDNVLTSGIWSQRATVRESWQDASVSIEGDIGPYQVINEHILSWIGNYEPMI